MSYIATSATQQHGSVRDFYTSGRTYQLSSGMALTIVFLVCFGLAWTDGFQSNSTDILASLQERLSLERLSSCDSISLITEVLVREMEVRSKHQVEVERRITEQRVDFDKRITAQRTEFESEIVKLQRQLTNGTVGPAIAFSARARFIQEGLTRYQKINFHDMLTNIGEGYNNDTSVFRCPVRGVYQFVVTILVKPKAKIDMELMAAGVSRMNIYSGGATYSGTGTNSVLLELQAGDEVYVRCLDSDGYVYGNYLSTFNGHLFHKL